MFFHFYYKLENYFSVSIFTTMIRLIKHFYEYNSNEFGLIST